jgi:hypothetical protein
MSLGGLLLGVINIAIVVAVFLLVGALVLWFFNWWQTEVPQIVQRCYLAVVFLIALYMLAALLLGLPSIGPLHTGIVR